MITLLNIRYFVKRALAIAAIIALPVLANAAPEQAVVSDIDHTGMGTFSGMYVYGKGPDADHPWFVFNAHAGDVININVNTSTWVQGSYIWLYLAPDGCVEVGDYASNETLEQLNLQPGNGQGGNGSAYSQSYTITTTGQYALQLDSREAGSGLYTVTLAGATVPTMICGRRTRPECGLGQLISNAFEADTDGDGDTDVCDNDDDNDGVPDISDNCPTLAHADKTNTDGDSQADACDLDDDNDGVPDDLDCDPLDYKKDKVLICHKGKTICVSLNALQAFLDEEDYIGPCSVVPALNRAAPAPELQQDAVAANVTFAVFPNPNNGQFMVRMNNTFPTQAEVLIMDAKGATVETKQVQLTGAGQTLSVNLKNKKPGMYLVKVISGGVVQTAKLAVQ